MPRKDYPASEFQKLGLIAQCIHCKGWFNFPGTPKREIDSLMLRHLKEKHPTSGRNTKGHQ